MRVWTTHYGGECPVEPAAIVMVWLRDQSRKDGPAYTFQWQRQGNAADVMYYRVLEVPA